MGTNVTAIRATGAAPLRRHDTAPIATPRAPHEPSRFSELLARPNNTASPTGAPPAARVESTPGVRGASPETTPNSSTDALTDAGRRLLARVARGERYVEQVVRGASAGAAYTPADLLAIQAQVYRYTQEVELVSKFVDRATSGVKTVLQQGS
jgi:hypothetical protein